MEDPESGRPLKRFKHQSYQATLKTLHPPSASAQSKLDEDIPDSESHFHNALKNWRQLNISPVFIRFAGQVQGLSASLPLLVHHSQEIALLWIETARHSDDDTLRVLLDLLGKLVHDLRGTLLPSYMPLVEILFTFLPKTLSAETLTVLLATFSLFFKHLLSPNAELLAETWSSLIGILPLCNSEIQRATAEVWATVFRRYKGGSREKAVALILQDVDKAPDACAWMLVYALKSVAHTLHTCSSSLFDTLLSLHLLSPNRTRTEFLMRRVITALIHHCENAEQFLPVSDLLTTRLITVTSHDEIPFVMDLSSISCSVRKGSRMTQKQISTILSHLAQKSLPSDLKKHVLTLAAAALLAGEMPVWMGPGRRFVEVSWENYSLGLELSGALLELEWGGWRLIELPFTLKYTAQLIDAHPRATLRLLAVLAQGKKLDDAEEAWLRSISASVQGRLETWDASEEKIEELECILSLSKHLPSIAPGLIRIANNALDASENGATNGFHDETRRSPGTTFGSCLLALAESPNQEWAQQIDVYSWVTRALRSWGTCELALGGLVAISRKNGTRAFSISTAEVYPWLQASISSHSHRLRLHALELLTAPVIEHSPNHDLIVRCLQGEKVSLDVQGVRERALRITGVSQNLRDGDDLGIDICARWLTAQLKVNLRPLWNPAIKALGSLSERFGDAVWRLVFGELERIVRGDILRESVSSSAAVELEGIKEAERSWRDPSALKLRSSVDKWSRGAAGLSVSPQAPPDRLDATNYEAQLLQVLGGISTLTRKHNAELVRLFLSFASPELPSKPSRSKLSNWIFLFSRLDNPKAFHQSSTLLLLYRSLLSHPDRDLQSLALTCILNYKSPHLIPYETNLRALLDDTKWRDELTSFDIAGIEDADRTEVIDVIIRLFFGMMLERRGRARGADRRASLLGALGGCREEELKALVDLMLEPLAKSSVSLDTADNRLIESSEKQWAGFTNLLGDVLKRMGSRLVLYWPPLLVATIQLITWAQTSLDSITDITEKPGDDNVDVDEHPDHEAASPLSRPRSMRMVRRLGIRRFTDFFRCEAVFDFGPYIPSAFSGFISSRLATLERENIQSPSAILDLFHAWSLRRDFIYLLVDHDDRILPQTYACLQAVNVKPTVVSRIFDIIEHIISFSAEDNQIAERVLKPHISCLLDGLAIQLPAATGAPNDLLHRQVGILSQVAQFVPSASQAQRLLQHFLPLLRQSPKIVPEKTKVHLLKLIQDIMPVAPDLQDHSSVTYIQVYDLFSKLFQTFKGKPARTALLEAFNKFSIISTDLHRVSGLLASINAWSLKRMDEPDFNLRIQAFTALNEDLYHQLSPREWQPILYNMLQFIHDPDELVIRTNAALSLKRYIDLLSSRGNHEFDVLFTRILYPGIKHGILSKIESVRSEILGVLAYSVLKCDGIPSLMELRPLLANGDTEANFFNNVYHIQTHRRTRAIRRLVEHVDSENVRSTTLSDIFVPLLGHFITDASTTDHILVDVTITATGSMARLLSWGAYNALVRHYIKRIKEKTLTDRACVRALVAILENFHFPMDDVVVEEEPGIQDLDEKSNAEDPSPLEESALTEAPKSTTGILTKNIADSVSTRLLPNLLEYLERRNDNEDALRIPVSIGIVQVARHLPRVPREAQISRLLTVLCQVFRSKSHETRTLARETLCKIAKILGPPYFHPIITELRAALLRGPHLHVLATVVHALVVHVTSSGVSPMLDNLDSCAADVAHVSAEVIFGQSGHDVHAEGFKTTMPEVRGSSSKGLDAFAILAKHVTPSSISALLNPIRAIMHETGALKTLHIVDDLLRRISGGLNANMRMTPLELLLLCHTLIEQNSRFLEASRPVKSNGRAKGHFSVQTKRSVDQIEDHYVHNSFRFVAFGLDLFNAAFRRGRFNFQDPQVTSRLEPMVAVIGNTLYSQDASVVIQGLKATAMIIKCPLRSVEKSLPVFVRQTLHIVRQAGNTESEMVQSAFRTLTVIIRDCPASQLQEDDLVYLLEVVTPDLEESNRQAAVFGLLRAIVSRKFVIAEIYEIMDKVAEIMVTNQSAQVQELCRAVFLQFLLEYPQGKGKLRNRMTFLAQNLSYVFESGRKSVMELLNAIFSKFEPGLVREHADLFFVALVLVIANDDSSKCREMAAELVKRLFTHLDVTDRRTMISHLHSWSSQKARLQLSRVSAQVYGFVVDTLQQEITPYLPGLLEDTNEMLQRSAIELRELESNNNDGTMDIDVEWQLPYHALNTINKVLSVHPELTKEASKIDWASIGSHLLFPHAWVRSASSRLIGLLLNANPPGAPDPGPSADSLTSLSGLIEIARKSSIQLKSDTLDSSLSLQVVKNLFYIGKCFCSILQSNESEVNAVEVGLNKGTGDISIPQEADVLQEIEDKLENIRGNPLPWLFSMLSYQARSAWIIRRNRSVGQDNWSGQPLAIFRWFAAMSSYMEPVALNRFLVHILAPVYRVIDDDTVRDEQIGILRTLAQELVELVQGKIGTSKFVEVYNQIRQGVVAVRRERKMARTIQATAAPQASARRKIKRNLAKKDSRARRDRMLAEGNIRSNRAKKRRIKKS